MRKIPMFWGVPRDTEHGNWPILSTEFEKIVHILANFGNARTGGHGYFLF